MASIKIQMNIKKKLKQELLNKIDDELKICGKAIQPFYGKVWDLELKNYIKIFNWGINDNNDWIDNNKKVIPNKVTFEVGNCSYSIFKTVHSLTIFRKRIKCLSVQYF